MLRYLLRLTFTWFLGVFGSAAAIVFGGWCGIVLAESCQTAVGGQTFGMILGAVFGGFIHIRIFNKLESMFFPPAKIVYAEAEGLDSRVIHEEVPQEQVQVEYDGCVYCLSNPLMVSGVYKVGFTTLSPYKRAYELYQDHRKSVTGVPAPYEVEFYFRCMDPYKVEQMLHRRLASCRVNPKREYFRIDLQELKQVFYENVPEPFECVEGRKR